MKARGLQGKLLDSMEDRHHAVSERMTEQRFVIPHLTSIVLFRLESIVLLIVVRALTRAVRNGVLYDSTEGTVLQVLKYSCSTLVRKVYPRILISSVRPQTTQQTRPFFASHLPGVP